MTYFCFIESDILTVPHMEPLTAEALDDAKIEAAAMLERHSSGLAAHIFEGETRLATILAGRRSQPGADGSVGRRWKAPRRATE